MQCKVGSCIIEWKQSTVSLVVRHILVIENNQGFIPDCRVDGERLAWALIITKTIYIYIYLTFSKDNPCSVGFILEKRKNCPSDPTVMIQALKCSLRQCLVIAVKIYLLVSWTWIPMIIQVVKIEKLNVNVYKWRPNNLSFNWNCIQGNMKNKYPTINLVIQYLGKSRSHQHLHLTSFTPYHISHSPR